MLSRVGARRGRLAAMQTKTINAHFDGKVLVPDEPVQLPVNEPLRVSVQTASETEEPPLMRLVRALDKLPHRPDGPTDGAAQHDHYLYGTPKRTDP